MAAVGQLSVQDLMFPFKDSFHAKVDIEPLISVMDEGGMLKKKEKRMLERFDESAKKSFVYNKLYGAGKGITPDRVVKLFEDTGNELNVHFAKALLSKLSAMQESAKSGQYTMYKFYIKNIGV